ncbi:NBR1-Ig-like domain-containing protein [Burkholderia ubonensis]|nr:NBR1-Ig-like domain-containing protein [Burkholderia ubonensis]
MREAQMDTLLSRRARELGKTVKELAADAGLTRTYLYKLVSGDTQDPSIRTLIRLAAALKISPIPLFRYFGMCHESVDRGVRLSRQLVCSRGVQNTDDSIEFIADITVPDHSMMYAGETFRKIWQVQNTGSIPWRKRRLVRVDDQYVIARRREDGSLLPLVPNYLASLSNSISIAETLPGGIVEIAVDFVAPPERCSVASIWRMECDRGTACFPSSFFLQVVVTVVSG